jgi:hypothetical protein
MAEEQTYNVFLSYSEGDRDAVERIARFLQEEKQLRVFLDRWHLVPGREWQPDVEAALDASETCAVFLGPGGIGPWDNVQMRAALTLRVEKQGYRVIPVLLPGTAWPERGKLPLFLALHKWVDFRTGLDDAQARHELVCGIQGIAPGPGPDTHTAVCPFRGLEAFQEEHAAFFFGRERLIQELVEALRWDRFLAVIGPSGAGKSSLVRAGLIPAVRQGRLGASEDWLVLLFKPGAHPLEMLAARLVPRTVAEGARLEAQQVYLAQLAQDETGLDRIVRARLSSAPDTQRTLIVVDQFEEVFTSCQDAERRLAFIDNLLYASMVEGGQAMVVVTMRADFFGRCAMHPTLAARMSAHQVLVGPLHPVELRQVIEEPARLVKLEYEKGLVETMLRDLGDAPGGLPVLQHTLWRLWHEGRRGGWLTIDGYHAIGGVQGALSQWADEVYTRLVRTQQEMARRIFVRLTQPGEGTEDTRLRVRQQELLPQAPAPGAAEASRTLQTLTDAHLLTTGQDEQAKRVVEVAHEALIRHWPRLHAWIDEDRARLLLQRQLAEAARAWEGSEHEASYLYRGFRLTEVKQKLPPARRSPLEAAFVQASVQAQRRRRATWGGIGTLVLALVAAIALVIWQARPAWRQLFDEDQVWALAATDETSPTLYLGTKDSGLRRSQDGVTWEIIREGLPTVEPSEENPAGRNYWAVTRLAVDSQDSAHVVAAISRYGLYESWDRGESWRSAGSVGMTIELARETPDGSVLDLAVRGGRVFAVVGMKLRVREEGEGGEWRVIGGEGDEPFEYIYTVHVTAQEGILYVGTGTGLYRASAHALLTESTVWEAMGDGELDYVIDIAAAPPQEETLYVVAYQGNDETSPYQLYRWRTGDAQMTRLGGLPDLPKAIRPLPHPTGPVIAYLLLVDNQVYALGNDGELAPLESTFEGIAHDLWLSRHPRNEKLWLLVGHVQGLYEYGENITP